MANHSGICGRCSKPTGSRYRRFCDACRYVKVRAENLSRDVPVRAFRKPRHKPQAMRFVARAAPQVPPRVSWWAARELTPQMFSALAAQELPRMNASKYGQARGGLAQDIN